MKDQSLEHALTVRIGELEERIKDYQDCYEEATNNPPSNHENHCSCVMYYVMRIKELEEENKKLKEIIEEHELDLIHQHNTCPKCYCLNADYGSPEEGPVNCRRCNYLLKENN